MKKWFRLVRTQVKSACYGVVRNFSMSFFSIIAISLTLVLISVFSIIVFNIDHLAQRIQANIQLRVAVDNYARANEKLELLKSIEGTSGVQSAIYSSKDQELILYTSRISEGQKLLRNYRGAKNPLRDVIIVRLQGQEQGDPLTKLQQLAAIIQKYPHVVEVDYGGLGVESLIKIVSAVRLGSFVITLLLSFFSISLIANTIKTNIYSRKSEISIMKNVGASNGFIACPFLIEGLLLGCLGALVPIFMTVVGYMLLRNYLGHFLRGAFFLLDTMPFTGYLSGYLLLVAMSVGIMGSYLAIVKHMDNKR